MVNRKARALIGANTVEILERREYQCAVCLKHASAGRDKKRDNHGPSR